MGIRDRNGRDKGKQAHMELIIEQRKMIAEKLFEEHITEFADNVVNYNITIEEKMKLVSNYMPPEPELDSYVYYCLLYTSDAADDLLCVVFGGRRIIQKKLD